jgi:hypothetical protein
MTWFHGIRLLAVRSSRCSKAVRWSRTAKIRQHDSEPWVHRSCLETTGLSQAPLKTLVESTRICGPRLTLPDFCTSACKRHLRHGGSTTSGRLRLPSESRDGSHTFGQLDRRLCAGHRRRRSEPHPRGWGTSLFRSIRKQPVDHGPEPDLCTPRWRVGLGSPAAIFQRLWIASRADELI